MSLNEKGLSCAGCKAYLFEEDDIVYCPVCGAPHHRECYNRTGHCALEELHGTENEYDAEKAARPVAEEKNESEKAENGVVTCGICGERYSRELNKCPKCSAPDFAKINPYSEFDFLGGVPADLKLEDDITAKEATRFVAANTHRYIPKFALLNKNNRVSWNWMAFLFPCGWMLSRKMYKNGIITGILSIIATFLTYPLNLALYNLGLAEGNTYADIVTGIVEKLPEIGAAVFILAMLGFVLKIVIRVISALFGDYFYRSYALSAIKEIKTQSDDPDYDYRKKGGVNILLFFVGTMLIQYIPSIIAMFI